MAKIKGISKEIDSMGYEEVLNLAKTQKLKTTGKQKSRRGKGKTKKKVCIHCGKRNPEYACERCAAKDKNGEKQNNICFNHAVSVDIGMTLTQRSRLKLYKYKEHPVFFVCLNDEGKGCAKKVVKAMSEAIK